MSIRGVVAATVAFPDLPEITRLATVDIGTRTVATWPESDGKATTPAVCGKTTLLTARGSLS